MATPEPNIAGAELLADTIGPKRSHNQAQEDLTTSHPQTSKEATNVPPTNRSPTPSIRDKTELSSKSSSASIHEPTTSPRDIEKSSAQPPPPSDPNIVDWDGPDDPLKAVNWPRPRKWLIVSVLSFLTFVTPLASSMFAPGVPQVMSDFDSSSLLLSSFVVSVYVLGYAAGPIFIAPLSELYGRRALYNVTNVLFIVFTIACAVAGDLSQLVGFRFLEGLLGSAVLTMGGGTLADLFVQEERGRAMAIWSSGPLLGPVVGPIAGGFLAQAKGWRWVFWVITIAAGVATAICFVVLKETYSPIILEAKARRLRKETGNSKLRSRMDSGLGPMDAFWRAIVRPSKMLLFSPIVLGLSVYNAIVYGYLYLLFTTITLVFEDSYGFSAGIVGLTFLGIGVGMILGLVIFGILSDKILKKKAASGEMKPEYRLPPMIPAAFLIPAGLFIYGWTAEKHVHWFVPIFGTSWLGFGIIATFMAIQTYLVDAFTLHAASAIAANTILRSLLGALLPLAGPSMYAKLGLGWGNSLLGFIGLGLLPIPFLFSKYGERIRKSPRFQIQL
ncbi:MAG: hypothetical protein MMC23_002251 [Stictis urceolatum]|nr:hypothetical protein [Stictis urceolata]